MPALPTEDQLDGDAPGFNQGVFKQALRDMRGFLATLFGTTGTQDAVYATLKLLDPQAIYNLKPVFTVGANALTCTVKGAGEVNLAAANLGFIGQRAAIGDGDFNLRKIAANVALTIVQGATVGHASGTAGLLFWYLIEKDANTQKLAVCGTYQGQSGIFSTTLLDVNADADNVLYADEAMSNKPGRLVAITLDTQATAGTWTALPGQVSRAPFDRPIEGLEEDVAPTLANDFAEIFSASAGKRKKARLSALATVTATVRQTVLSAAIDANGYSALLSAGAGLNFNVDASPTAAVLTFANGFGASGAVDLTTVLSSDVSNQGALAASNTNFVYAARSSGSAVTWGQSLVPPQYDYSFNRGKHAILNFEGADGSTTILDDFGNTWTASGNAQIDTAQAKFGTASLLLDGTGDFISTTNITSLGEGSWVIEGWVRFNALPVSTDRAGLVSAVNAGGYGAELAVYNNAGTYQLRTSLSSTGASVDIANDTASAITAPSTGVWYHWAIGYDALAGSYKTYWDGAAKHSIASSARLCAITKVELGRNAAAGSETNGWLDGIRILPCCPYPAAFAPPAAAPAITDYAVHFFSIPEMKMYEVTGASAGAGTNPTMTQRTRLFVGEIDTSGASVSAVRNYALRGEYRGVQTFPVQNTTTSISHNIGTAIVVATPKAMMKTSQSVSDGAAYLVGEEADLHVASGATATPRTGNHLSVTRNTVRIRNDNGHGLSLVTLSASRFTITPDMADLVVYVRRNF